jgi:hypothetical protein
MIRDCGVKLFATDSPIIKFIRLNQSVNLWHSFAFHTSAIERFLVQMIRDCGVKLFATDSPIIKFIRLNQSVNLWHSFAFHTSAIERFLIQMMSICHRFTGYKKYPIESICESVAFICISQQGD